MTAPFTFLLAVALAPAYYAGLLAKHALIDCSEALGHAYSDLLSGKIFESLRLTIAPAVPETPVPAPEIPVVTLRTGLLPEIPVPAPAVPEPPVPASEAPAELPEDDLAGKFAFGPDSAHAQARLDTNPNCYRMTLTHLREVAKAEGLQGRLPNGSYVGTARKADLEEALTLHLARRVAA